MRRNRDNDTEEYATVADVKAIVQEVVQQVQQSTSQFGSQKSVQGHESISHDIGQDEAWKSGMFDKDRKYSYNDKLLLASEHQHFNDDHSYNETIKSVRLRREQNAADTQEQLNEIKVQSARRAALVEHMLNTNVLNYRETVQESQLPMLDDDLSLSNIAEQLNDDSGDK